VRKHTSKDGVTVNAVAGTHVVLLGFDLTPERRKGCLGFAIQREDRTEDERYWMSGMKTFAETDPGLGPGGQVSSREHPFQGFQWADYSAKPDHDYTYSVIPLYGKPADLTEGPRRDVRITTEVELASPHSVFFNRGAVASQEYARRFMDKKPSELDPEQRKAAYKWLSRGLFEALLAFLERAKGPGWGLRAAIYEFQWDDALAAFGAAAARGVDVKVLYDSIGASTAKKNKAHIAATGIQDLCEPRTVGKIMHNKFVVLTRNGSPVAVWTGSTNLTENGIFGHLNCGHIVEDRGLARQYLDYWTELGTNPDSDVEKSWMAEHNPNPPEDWKGELVHVFSPHKGNKILDWYAELAGGADDALFMTFAFGMDERFKNVYRRDDDVLRVALMDREGSRANLEQAKVEIRAIRRRRNVVIAVGNNLVTGAFDRWLKERGGLTSNVQWVHTKFMLVDPLSRTPTVITGSANFSTESTSGNNENMLVIHGDKRVADIYFTEFSRLYTHYAFREAVKIARESGETDWQPKHLDPTPGWQAEYFEPGNDRCLRRLYFAYGRTKPAGGG
jgi:phosphatidylserine/phosphatidylglycerophosphate/cardiolipin synthase-like enzyme